MVLQKGRGRPPRGGTRLCEGAPLGEEQKKKDRRNRRQQERVLQDSLDPTGCAPRLQGKMTNIIIDGSKCYTRKQKVAAIEAALGPEEEEEDREVLRQE